MHLVGPETQEIFETFSENDDDLKTALTKLNICFSPETNIPFEKHKFHEAKQEPEESIDAFVTRLRKLAEYCDFGVSLNDHVRDIVISKCRSTKFRERLLVESDVALEKDLEISSLMENADRRSQAIKASNSSSSRNGVVYPVNRVHKSKASGATVERNYLVRQSSSVNIQVKSCYRCRHPGHLANDCTVTKGKKCDNCQKAGHFATMFSTETFSYQSFLKHSDLSESVTVSDVLQQFMATALIRFPGHIPSNIKSKIKMF